MLQRKKPSQPKTQLPKKPPLKQQRGKQGEQLAKKLLQNKGYQFLTQNFRTRLGEIDLIFQDKEMIVFVEVKARTSFEQGLPEEAVTPQKLAKIQRAAEEFLIKYHLESKPARIDVVAIELDVKPPVIRHIPNVTG